MALVSPFDKHFHWAVFQSATTAKEGSLQRVLWLYFVVIRYSVFKYSRTARLCVSVNSEG
jgi:hypothetical protein